MQPWRKICDELIEAGEKATARPWKAHDDSEHIPGDFEPNRVLDSRGYSLADVTGDSDDLQWGNTAYIALAANNADRLARFAVELALQCDALAEQLAGKGAIHMSQQLTAEYWDKSADPVAELSSLGEAVKMPEPEGGGSVGGGVSKIMKPLSIEAAKRFAKSIGADGVVILAFTRDRFAHTTYGRNREDCSTMRRLAEYLAIPIESGALDPWDPPRGPCAACEIRDAVGDDYGRDHTCHGA